jgi:hypothetical protein
MRRLRVVGWAGTVFAASIGCTAILGDNFTVDAGTPDGSGPGPDGALPDGAVDGSQDAVSPNDGGPPTDGTPPPADAPTDAPPALRTLTCDMWATPPSAAKQISAQVGGAALVEHIDDHTAMILALTPPGTQGGDHGPGFLMFAVTPDASNVSASTVIGGEGNFVAETKIPGGMAVVLETFQNPSIEIYEVMAQNLGNPSAALSLGALPPDTNYIQNAAVVVTAPQKYIVFGERQIRTGGAALGYVVTGGAWTDMMMLPMQSNNGGGNVLLVPGKNYLFHGFVNEPNNGPALVDIYDVPGASMGGTPMKHTLNDQNSLGGVFGVLALPTGQFAVGAGAIGADGQSASFYAGLVKDEQGLLGLTFTSLPQAMLPGPADWPFNKGQQRWLGTDGIVFGAMGRGGLDLPAPGVNLYVVTNDGRFLVKTNSMSAKGNLLADRPIQQLSFDLANRAVFASVSFDVTWIERTNMAPPILFYNRLTCE